MSEAASSIMAQSWSCGSQIAVKKKLFAKEDDKLEWLVQTVKKFSDDIGIKFGLEKCVKAIFLKKS